MDEPIRSLVDCIREKLATNEPFRMNFICTHKSRRSQMAQAWTEAIAHHFGIPIETGSGGAEVSALQPNDDIAWQECGFHVTGSNVDENCPFIPGAEKRVPLKFEDPMTS